MFHQIRVKLVVKPQIEKLMRMFRQYCFFDVLNEKRREFWLLEDVVNRNRNDFNLINEDSFCKMAQSVKEND